MEVQSPLDIYEVCIMILGIRILKSAYNSIQVNRENDLVVDRFEKQCHAYVIGGSRWTLIPCNLGEVCSYIFLCMFIYTYICIIYVYNIYVQYIYTYMYNIYVYNQRNFADTTQVTYYCCNQRSSTLKAPICRYWRTTDLGIMHFSSKTLSTYISNKNAYRDIFVLGGYFIYFPLRINFSLFHQRWSSTYFLISSISLFLKNLRLVFS